MSAVLCGGCRNVIVRKGRGKVDITNVEVQRFLWKKNAINGLKQRRKKSKNKGEKLCCKD